MLTRHHLAAGAPDAVAAVRSVVAMHSSDPLTPYLGIRARLQGCTVADVERALYAEGRLRRIHAMRRTLWVVPTEDVTMFDAAAGQTVARRERTRVRGWVAEEVGADDLDGWLSELEDRTLEVLSDHPQGLPTRELTAHVPELSTEITVGSGRWAARTPLSSRLLSVLAMEGTVVRGRPLGSWRSSQYRWVAAEHAGGRPQPADEDDASDELVRRYLAAFGPATAVDIRWWTGWTVARTERPLDRIQAVPVLLDDGSDGYVLPGDEEDGTSVDGGSVALLPGLDPTPMGWKGRGWFLGEHADATFDRNGNAGPTIWVGGRVVGVWTQRSDGTVVHHLLEDVGREATHRIADEIAGLTAWLDGQVMSTRFPGPLERRLLE